MDRAERQRRMVERTTSDPALQAKKLADFRRLRHRDEQRARSSMVEQGPLKAQVAGSIPAERTNQD